MNHYMPDSFSKVFKVACKKSQEGVREADELTTSKISNVDCANCLEAIAADLTSTHKLTDVELAVAYRCIKEMMTNSVGLLNYGDRCVAWDLMVEFLDAFRARGLKVP